MDSGILIVLFVLVLMASIITVNVIVETKRIKKLPVDRDNDGWIYEGTPKAMKVTKKKAVKKVAKKATKKAVKKTTKKKAVKKKK